MRQSLVAQATRRTLRPTPKLEIFPPLALYRRILRAHRLLPYQQRMLGDSYLKAEFRAHRNIDNPVQIIGFLSQWQKYLEQIVGNSWQHGNLDMDKIQQMEPDKIVQLYELMMAAQGKEAESVYNAIPLRESERN